MTPEEYSTTQSHLLLVANLLTRLDLDGFIETAQRSLAVGPLLDPTVYMRASNRLDAVVRIARAATKVQKALREARKLVIEEERRAGRAVPPEWLEGIAPAEVPCR